MYPRSLNLIALIGALLMTWTTESVGETIRIATYNASLYGKRAGEIKSRLESGRDQQAQKVAAIVQTVRPDILLINEIDYDDESATATLLAVKYFAQSQGNRTPVLYPYIYAAPSNTGINSELDLNNNGRTGEPNDAFGFGVYPGQYSLAVYSRFPIDIKNLRTFQQLLWKDLPGANRPVDPKTKQSFYDDKTWAKLRLSSKNHVDVPVQLGEKTIHVLASHPTPPVFDGPEDRNGHRNQDEIRFWEIYLSPNAATSLQDDAGGTGGLPEHQPFVIMGDLNSDPADGDSQQDAIKSLLAHPRTVDPAAASQGAVEASLKRKSPGDPKLDTAKFGRGNMRVDYVLPSQDFVLKNSGVFWPPREHEDHELISASDHRMVWIEVEVP